MIQITIDFFQELHVKNPLLNEAILFMLCHIKQLLSAAIVIVERHGVQINNSTVCLTVCSS